MRISPIFAVVLPVALALAGDPPPAPLPEAGYARAVALEHEGKLLDADGAYGQLLSSAVPANEASAAFRDKLLLGRARTLYRDNLPSSALAVLDDVSADDSGEATYLKVLSLAKLGENDKAALVAGDFLETRISPTNEVPPFAAEIRFWLAAFSYRNGDFANAERRFLKFAEYHPDHASAPGARLLAGAAAFKLRDYAVAAQHFVSLVKAHPEDPRVPLARFLQAKALLNLARFEDAVLVLDDLLERFPDAAFAVEACLLRGDALRAASGGTDHFREAAVSYATALVKSGITPDQAALCSRKLAKCQAEAGDEAAARATIAQFSQIDRDGAQALQNELFGNFPGTKLEKGKEQ